MNIDCETCNARCCRNPLTPILLPSEEERLREFSRIVKTPSRMMQVLRKKEEGSCIFLDDKQMCCTAYDRRPLECRLYPFLLDFSKENPDVKLDERFCQSLATLTHDINQILWEVRRHEFSKDWIKSYDSLVDY